MALTDTAVRRSATTSGPVTARVAVALFFFVNGAVGGSWFARIPAVQQGLGLSEGVLGAALLCVAAGALLAMPAAGGLVARLGSHSVTVASGIALCAVLPCLALAPTLPLLIPALAAYGAAFGMLDVAMNTQAVAVERRYARPIMASFHAAYSIGGMVGAGLGGIVAARGIGPGPHLLGVAAVLLLAVLAAARPLLPAGADLISQGPVFARPSRSLVALGIVGFCVLVVEGAMADWSAVYLRRSLGTGEGLAAAGFTAFSLAMAAGRLVGDRLTAWLGPVRLVRLGASLAAAGFGLALALGHPVAALAGFAAVGLGFAALFPIILSAAGRAPDMPPGPAIAAVTTFAYGGFLAGPPLIGFAAELVGLPAALGVVVLLSLIVALLARSTSPAAAPA